MKRAIDFARRAHGGVITAEGLDRAPRALKKARVGRRISETLRHFSLPPLFAMARPSSYPVAEGLEYSILPPSN